MLRLILTSFLAAGLIVLLSAAPLVAETLTAVGYGPTRSSALENAQRLAVEQGVVILIDSQTRVTNSVILYDHIYSRASGYISRYTVLPEGQTADGMFTVSIQAAVHTGSIKNDLQAIGVLLSRVDNPRFMILYTPQTGRSLHRDSGVVQGAERAIGGVFNDKGFLLLAPNYARRIYDEIELAGRINVDRDDLARLALDYPADVLLLLDMQATQQTGGQSRHFQSVDIAIQLEAISPATAEIYASSPNIPQPVRIPAGQPVDITADSPLMIGGGHAAGKKVAEAVVDRVVKKLEEMLEQGIRFDIWFRNFSEPEILIIGEVLQSMHGYRSKTPRTQSPGNIQMDVRYRGNKSDFQRELIQGLNARGLGISTEQSKGNRLLMFKEGTNNPYYEFPVH